MKLKTLLPGILLLPLLFPACEWFDKKEELDEDYEEFRTQVLVMSDQVTNLLKIRLLRFGLLPPQVEQIAKSAIDHVLERLERMNERAGKVPESVFPPVVEGAVKVLADSQLKLNDQMKRIGTIGEIFSSTVNSLFKQSSDFSNEEKQSFMGQMINVGINQLDNAGVAGDLLPSAIKSITMGSLTGIMESNIQPQEAPLLSEQLLKEIMEQVYGHADTKDQADKIVASVVEGSLTTLPNPHLPVSENISTASSYVAATLKTLTTWELDEVVLITVYASGCRSAVSSLDEADLVNTQLNDNLEQILDAAFEVVSELEIATENIPNLLASASKSSLLGLTDINLNSVDLLEQGLISKVVSSPIATFSSLALDEKSQGITLEEIMQSSTSSLREIGISTESDLQKGIDQLTQSAIQKYQQSNPDENTLILAIGKIAKGTSLGIIEAELEKTMVIELLPFTAKSTLSSTSLISAKSNDLMNQIAGEIGGSVSESVGYLKSIYEDSDIPKVSSAIFESTLLEAIQLEPRKESAKILMDLTLNIVTRVLEGMATGGLSEDEISATKGTSSVILLDTLKEQGVSNEEIEQLLLKLEDSTIEESPAPQPMVTPDTTAPTETSIVISSNNTTTTSTTVTIGITATDADFMYITNIKDCQSGGEWEPVQNIKVWTLNTTNATAFAYAKFKDKAGNESSCVSDSILHDNLKPSVPTNFLDGTWVIINTQSPLFSWNESSDSGSGIESYEIAIGSTSGDSDILDWTDVGAITSYTKKGLTLDFDTSYYGQVRALDQAGNIGDAASGDGFLVKIIPTRLELGNTHSCALFNHGKVKCWGGSNFGALGYESTDSLGDGAGEMGSNLPYIDFGTDRTVIMMDGSYQYSCALLDNGQVKCWGENTMGQLGLGHTDPIGDGAGEMGDDLNAVDLGTGRTATYISAGRYHACAILDDNTLKCWGANESGQLGLGHTDTLGDAAGEMGDNLATVNLGNGLNAEKVYCGLSFTCAILNTGATKCWGINANGSLLHSDGSSKGDGANEMGDNLPVLNVGTGRTIKELAIERYRACAVLDNGDLKCWGKNEGQGALGTEENANHLGDNGTELGDDLPVVDLGSGLTATGVTVGEYSACAILNTGNLKCWGINDRGQLGIGSTTSKGNTANSMGDNLPLVNLGSGVTITHVNNGAGKHMCAILSDYTVKCWGYNNQGQLGIGNADQKGDNSSHMGDNLVPVILQ